MAKYEEVKEIIREKINWPENDMRGITEATGLRILDGIYIIVELLQQNKSEGAEQIVNHQG